MNCFVIFINFFENSFLIQDSNDILLNKKLKIVTKNKPSISEIQSLKFALIYANM